MRNNLSVNSHDEIKRNNIVSSFFLFLLKHDKRFKRTIVFIYVVKRIYYNKWFYLYLHATNQQFKYLKFKTQFYVI